MVAPLRVPALFMRQRSRDLIARRNRRGVSPIIATILLVAITVVLAAVLYVFLIPLVSHVNAPLQGNLDFGVATCYGPVSGCTSPGPNATGCSGNVVCWAIPIQTPSSSAPSPSALQMYVQNQLSQTVSTSNWNFSILTDQAPPGIVAYAPGSIAGYSGSGWTAMSPYTTGSTLTETMTLWIDSGSASSFAGQSLKLIVTGVNGYSGSLQEALPT